MLLHTNSGGGGELRDDTKNGCVADYEISGYQGFFCGHMTPANVNQRTLSKSQNWPTRLVIFFFFCGACNFGMN